MYCRGLGSAQYHPLQGACHGLELWCADTTAACDLQGALEPSQSCEVVLQIRIVGGSGGSAEMLAASQVMHIA